jgi:hypothetical protein
MPIYAPVFEALYAADVPFLVIGGHAVVLHGYQRNTFDLDLLIAEGSLPAARPVLLELGYNTYFESGAFLQLSPRANLPPLDLMIVDQTTFDRLSQFTESRVLDGKRILIPDPLRLVALKLHALKAVSRSDRDKDWADIAGVIRAAVLDLENPEFQAIIERYGPLESNAELRRRL